MSQVLAIGHRGAPEVRPENTIASINEAIAQGADGVEIDVRLTADDQIVLWHDPSIPDGDGGEIIIREVALEELLTFDLTAITNSTWSESTHIATLAEALDATRNHILDIEMKNLPIEPLPDNEHVLASAVAEMTRGLEDRVIVTSFWTDALDALLAAAPSLRTGWLLIPSITPESVLEMALARGYNALLPEGNSLPVEAWDALERIRHEGLVTWAWTIDDESRIRDLIARGIDGVISNKPGLVASILR